MVQRTSLPTSKRRAIIRQVSLLVNEEPIPLDYFVQAIIDHTTGGMIKALEGTGPIKNPDLSIDL